jgi:hypothetical protein
LSVAIADIAGDFETIVRRRSTACERRNRMAALAQLANEMAAQKQRAAENKDIQTRLQRIEYVRSRARTRRV